MKKINAILSAALLLGAGCASPTTTQPTASPDATTPSVGADVSATLTASMDAGNFFFSPNTVTANAGQKVSITFKNVNGTHTFAIDQLGIEQNVSAGGVVTFTAPNKPGRYPFYCSIGSHRAMGMEGTLIVE